MEKFYELVESGNYFDIAVCTAVVVTSDMEPKYIHMPNIDLKFLLFGMKFSHVACVHSSQSMKNLGGFDEDVSIAMDTDYLLRAISSSYRFTTFDTLVFMGDDGISNKLWAKASLQYIRNLYRLNFIGPFKRILLTMAVPLRIINNHLKIISKLRDYLGAIVLPLISSLTMLTVSHHTFYDSIYIKKLVFILAINLRFQVALSFLLEAISA